MITLTCTASELGVGKPEQNGYELPAQPKKACSKPQVIFILKTNTQPRPEAFSFWSRMSELSCKTPRDQNLTAVPLSLPFSQLCRLAKAPGLTPYNWRACSDEEKALPTLGIHCIIGLVHTHFIPGIHQHFLFFFHETNKNPQSNHNNHLGSTSGEYL